MEFPWGANRLTRKRLIPTPGAGTLGVSGELFVEMTTSQPYADNLPFAPEMFQIG